MNKAAFRKKNDEKEGVILHIASSWQLIGSEEPETNRNHRPGGACGFLYCYDRMKEANWNI